MGERRPTLTTGVQGLDTLLGGGLPRRQSILITGEPGSGKTVLASQVAFHQVAQGANVVLATTTSESQTKLLEDLAGFSFFRREPIGKELFFISVYPWLKKGSKDALEVLISTVRERRAKLLVVDGLRSVRDLWLDEAKLRDFFYELSVGLAACDCTAVFITEYPLSKLIAFPESTTVDGIVSLSYEDDGPRRVRRAEVAKLRGMRHLSGKHVMRMGDEGVRIFPRLEATTVPDLTRAPAAGRAQFGLAELDQLLGGGLPADTSTLIAGSAGVGKTLLALHFAASGAVAGQKTLFFTATEPPRSLTARAARVGLDLAPACEQGLLEIVHDPSFEREADELVDWVLNRVVVTGARRLVFDDVELLERALEHSDRARSFFSAMLIQLRQAGVTSVFTRKISKLVGSELDFSDTALAEVSENLLFLRHVELRGHLHRVLSILNLRDSEYDNALREFVVRNEGIQVLNTIDTVEGLLTGQARMLGSDARGIGPVRE